MSDDLALASDRRTSALIDDEIDKRIVLLLANYERVAANPRSMGYLAPLLKHYSRSSHPFTDCVKDNTQRFGPGRVEKVCAVLKDTIRMQTHWRGKGPQPLDHGSPGVAIGEADKPFAPAWGGHHLSDDGIDYIKEALVLLEDIGSQCDIFRVLIGLDEPPFPSEALLLSVTS